MVAMTDARVKFEQAPFDHPSLNVPNFGILPAVGAAGRAEPVATFLGLSPFQTSATVAATSFAVSGAIVDAAGTPLAGVTVDVTGAATGTTVTDAEGHFWVVGLTDGAITVAPSKAGYTMIPATRAITVAGANIGGTDFVASTGTTTPPPPPPAAVTSSVFGVVRDRLRKPMAKVTVALAGPVAMKAVTNADGTYSFSNLPDGRYTVTFSRANYKFDPKVRVIDVKGADVIVKGTKGKTRTR